MKHSTLIAFLITVAAFGTFAIIAGSLPSNESKSQSGTSSSDGVDRPEYSSDKTFVQTKEEPKKQIDLFDLEMQIHEKINMVRQENGIPKLEYDATLTAIARDHSEDMYERNYFSHYSPDGKSPIDRGLVYGYEICGETDKGDHSYKPKYDYQRRVLYNGLGENLAKILYYDDADVVMDLWLNSEGHKRNILDEYRFTEGIGVYQGSDGWVYVTQNLC